MKKWVTEIRAIDPITNELRTFAGPSIQAESAEDAHRYCQENGLGYCRITFSWEAEDDVFEQWLKGDGV